MGGKYVRNTFEEASKVALLVRQNISALHTSVESESRETLESALSHQTASTKRVQCEGKNVWKNEE